MTYLLENKKAFGALFYLSLAVLLLSLSFMFLQPEEQIEEPIGFNQLQLLKSQEEAYIAQYYAQESLAFSTQFAKTQFIKHNGYFKELQETARYSDNNCGIRFYSLFVTESSSCIPQFKEAYQSYLELSFMDYLRTYQRYPLSVPFYYSFQQRTETDLFIQAKTVQPQRFYINAPSQRPSFQSGSFCDDQMYPSGSFGSFMNEKLITCTTGDCFADVARQMYATYLAKGISYSYVWGGESPYCYEDTIQHQQTLPDSIFKGVSVTAREPLRNTLTRPGFDCSGWVWWVGKHAGISLFDQRLTSHDYFIQAKSKQYELVCGLDKESCLLDTIQQKAKAGDILFYSESSSGQITHIMLYLGDGMISHSRGSIGLVEERLPSIYVDDSKTNIVAIYRPEFKQEGVVELNQSVLSSCTLQFDPSAIDEHILESHPRQSMERVQEILTEYNVDALISQAHLAYPQVPEQLIKAMIRVETGGVIEKYVRPENRDTCNSMGFCGLMQVGKPAADTVKYNYDAIRRGDLREGIMAGTAYLNYLLRFEDVTSDPDSLYYYIAIAYNAGPGSLQQIKQATARRLRLSSRQEVSFNQITYQDVVNGLNALGPAWAKETTKHEEVWRYPHYVGDALRHQCNYVSGVYGGSNFIERDLVLETTTNFDLEAYTSLTDVFIPQIQLCTDELDICVHKMILAFNQKYGERIHISLHFEDQPQSVRFVDEFLSCIESDEQDCRCVFASPQLVTGDLDSSSVLFTDKQQIQVTSLDETKVSFTYPISKPIGFYRMLNDNINEYGSLSVQFDEGMMSFVFFDGKKEFVLNEEAYLSLLKLSDKELKTYALNDEKKECAQVAQYAQQYLKTDFSLENVKEFCTYEQARQGTCLTTDLSFVRSAYRYALQETLKGKQSFSICEQDDMVSFTDSSLLQEGDIFVGRTGDVFHTGLYVGRGTLERIVSYKGQLKKPYFERFLKNKNAFPVFMQSIGPVSYIGLSDLETTYSSLTFCRPRICQDAYAPYIWEVHEVEQSYPVCKLPIHYYNFKAEIKDGVELTFSIFLNDTIAPAQIQELKAEQKMCGDYHALRLTWKAKNQIDLHSFKIYVKEQNGLQPDFYEEEFYVQNAKEATLKDISKTEQLFAESSLSEFTDYGVILKFIPDSKNFFEINETYVYGITGIDVFGNEHVLQEHSIKIIEPPQEFLEPSLFDLRLVLGDALFDFWQLGGGDCS